MVAAEVIKHGACTLTVGHIGALAGVSETTVRNAVREAKRLGLLHVEERRVAAFRNLPNRLAIALREWRSWLAMRQRGVGANSCTPRITSLPLLVGESYQPALIIMHWMHWPSPGGRWT